jgi:hypothetical protein
LTLLGALNRSLRYRAAVIRAALLGLDLHVCYSLSLDDDTNHADLLNISARCVRQVHPRARITILTDEQSLATAVLHLTNLIGNGVSIRSVGQFDGDARQRSRFVKTQARSEIAGDFLQLDADTVAVSEFSAVAKCDAPLSAAIDRNLVNPDGGFPSWVIPDYQRMGWPQPTEFYLNTGVVFWKENNEARALGRIWHDNWLKYFRTVDNPADQPAFNHSLNVLGIRPKIMSDIYNARLGVSRKYAQASIYHLLSGNERANGTFIDELVARYRMNGSVDFALIDKTARRGEPWIETRAR